MNLCSRYQPGGKVPAHKELLAEEARQLELFRAAMDTSQLSKATWDMTKCKVSHLVGQIISTHLYSQNDDGNPLNIWPPNPNSNYWVEISSYNRINDPEVLKLVLARTTAFDIQIDDKAVMRTAFLCSLISAMSSGDR